jgi:hypothetical protein
VIAAYKRSDVDGVRRYVHEDAEAYTFLVLQAETPFNGNDTSGSTIPAEPTEISKWLANEAAISKQIEPGSLDLVEVGGRVLGFGQMTLSANGNGNGNGLPQTVETAWVWETRDGKISYMASYLDPRDALGAVGLHK